jgi:hypothetical protein
LESHPINVLPGAGVAAAWSLPFRAMLGEPVVALGHGAGEPAAQALVLREFNTSA